ncbi:hypothetical protein BDQ17DRAFT_1323937 [Cyathus striatus]|nr:hypothetical protein BDQ17DRAFT_1323937 [Cyathus striatus]
MGRPKKSRKAKQEAAARARQGRAHQNRVRQIQGHQCQHASSNVDEAGDIFCTSDAEELFQPMEHELTVVEENEFDENNCTSWTGGVNHVLSESEDELEEWIEDGDNEGEGLDADLEELAPEEVLENLQRECQFQADMEVLSRPTPYEKVLTNKPTKFWKKAEAHWHLGYNGQSDRTKCYHSQQLHEKELKDAITRKSKTADKFHSFFAVHLQQSLDIEDNVDDTFHGYISDLSDNENEIEAWISDDEDSAEEVLTCSSNVIPPPLQNVGNFLFLIVMPENKRKFKK